jgi:hypothetical protein
MMLTPDEKRLLIDLVRCVKLIGWHVAELREGEGKAEVREALDNLGVIQRVIQESLQEP